MLTTADLEARKACLIDAIARGTAGADLKQCLYVKDEDILQNFNKHKIVHSFDVAVDRQLLLKKGWWIGHVTEPVSPDDVGDVIVARFHISSRPSVLEYEVYGYHVDGISIEASKQAVLLHKVDVFVPMMGNYIAQRGAWCIEKQLKACGGYYKYLVMATTAMLFKSASDIRNRTGMDSVNISGYFNKEVDDRLTMKYIGLCFFKIH